MQIVPLQAVPSQTLTVSIGSQSVALSVYTLNTPGDILATNPATELQGVAAVYVDVTLNGTAIATGRLARNLIPIMLTTRYAGLSGDFVFVDTQNVGLQDGTDPVYTGLGFQYQLVYLAPADL